VFIGLSIIPQQANSQINPCWKLVCPHDPANGFFNPDSVYVDTCQNNNHELAKTYTKKSISVITVSKIENLPSFSNDTIIYITLNDILPEHDGFKQTLVLLDSIFGHFKIRKKYPECVDSNIFASKILLLEFENYINIKDCLDSCKYYVNELVSFYSHLENPPKLNGKGILWKLIYEDNPLKGFVNPDSVMVDTTLENQAGLITSYAKQWFTIYLKYYLINYPYLPIEEGHIFKLTDVDTNNFFFYNSMIYMEKEFGEMEFKLQQAEKDTLGSQFFWLRFSNYINIEHCKYVLNRNKFFLAGTNYHQRWKIVWDDILEEPDNKIIDIHKNDNTKNLVINYNLNKSSYCEISLFNSQGKKIIDILKNFQNEGNYQITYNCESLSHGLYFIVLSDGTNTISKKFIK
jgi:hypothetical protein